ncbi:WYL domain-containing protein [Paenarthrobacter sp. PH39-S1]|uniref:helix-turn-helix transcriptional regulator n=1 Tax=Paenarthrobacter sp. PH39-S1 TaxID=3046204 RepID=UPI0024BBC0C0|nr:WYL domain-containing protein [Paenarthrobacter sp. PH39-S1]MDJ0356776.1 WYL domain-containing protein [Paenarthrobacter sp. PH39-S1]
MNLVIALLGSQYGRSREFLRTRIQGYDPKVSDEAFGRMFERDKVHLKRLGIPISTVRDPYAEDENSWKYLIRPEDYRLPEIRLEPEGLAVLSLAARVWEQASLGSAAARALRKLETVAGTEAAGAGPAMESRIRTKEPAFDALWDALLHHRRVSFSYRKSQDVAAGPRHVEPWGLGNRYGQWYLSGRDVSRGEPRLYRLSRIASDVTIDPGAGFAPPVDYDIAEALDSLGTGPQSEAVLEVPAGRGQLLRELAGGAVPAPRPGWDTLTVPYREPELLADDLASMGPAVVVLAPAALRDAVVRRLSGAATAAGAPLPTVDFSIPAAPVRHKPTGEDRLRRLLDLVPYLVQNSGIEAATVAEEFGISRKQLDEDLALLSVCGLPGYQHGELIDVQWDEGVVFIRDADELAKPLRLTQEEACALLVGLESLQSLPDEAGKETLREVLDSVRRVAGPDAWMADVVEARIAPETSLETLSILQRAVMGRGRVRITYLVRGRDDVTERVIEPMRIYSLDSLWYVEAWCTLSEGMRNFRMDGIRTAVAAPGTAPVRELQLESKGPARMSSPGVFMPGAGDLKVVLALDPDARWVADAYGARARAALPDGRTAVRITVGRAQTVPALMARLGGGGQVLEPEELRKASGDWLARALAGYPLPGAVPGAAGETG